MSFWKSIKNFWKYGGHSPAVKITQNSYGRGYMLYYRYPDGQWLYAGYADTIEEAEEYASRRLNPIVKIIEKEEA